MGILDGVDAETQGALVVGVIASIIAGYVTGFFRMLSRVPRSVIRYGQRQAGRRMASGESILPDTSGLLGREQELDRLGELVRADGRRVIGLIGAAGLGKSLLAARLGEVAKRRSRRPPFRRPFDDVFWLECRGTPPKTFDESIDRLIRFANPDLTDEERAAFSPDEHIDRFVAAATKRRLFVVFDNVEDLFTQDGGKPAGTFADQQYLSLLRALVERAHRSVVVVTSRERPAGIEFANDTAPPLGGLEGEAARQLLRDRGVQGSVAQLDTITDSVGGNPFWLIQAAAIAREEGGAASLLLGNPDLLTPEGDQLLRTQIDRIADSDGGRLLSAMAVFRRPVSRPMLGFLLETASETPATPSTKRAVDELVRRSLVERLRDAPSDRTYALHPQLQRFLLGDGDPRNEAHARAARAWLSHEVPRGMDAQSVDDVMPLVEAHYHHLAAGEVREAITLSAERRFGLNKAEGLVEFLTRCGYPDLRLDMESRAADAADMHGAPELRAGAQNNLGIAYAELPTGDRAENIGKAIAAFEAALRVYTEAAYPADWATTQNNLGNAYRNLPMGDRAENIGKAIAAFDAALRVYTEAAYPADWAATQNNLGIAYAELPTGDRAENIGKAIAAYDAALRVYTEAAYPADWATTQNNLGNAYRILPTGDRVENLGKAIAAYDAALRVYTEAAYPVAWAMTQNNLGIAYAELPTGYRAEHLRKAIAAFEVALRVRTEAAYPADWAATQNNLGTAYAELLTGDRAKHLGKAIAAYEAALRVYTEAAYPADWEMTRDNLAQARSELDSLG